MVHLAVHRSVGAMAMLKGHRHHHAPLGLADGGGTRNRDCAATTQI
jgi:hypothetical protein